MEIYAALESVSRFCLTFVVCRRLLVGIQPCPRLGGSSLTWAMSAVQDCHLAALAGQIDSYTGAQDTSPYHSHMRMALTLHAVDMQRLVQPVAAIKMTMTILS